MSWMMRVFLLRREVGVIELYFPPVLCHYITSEGNTY